MHNKDKYINNVINRFSGNAKDILLKQIELFYDVDNQIIICYALADNIH